MPTMTAIAWERLLEPKTRESTSSKKSSPPSPPPNPYFISPASAPDVSPTSPYIVNCKRRDLRPASALDGLEIKAKFGADRTDEGGPVEGGGRKEGDENSGLEQGLGRDEGTDEAEDGDFFDSQESMSVASSSDEGDSLRHSRSRNQTPFTNQSEFYDASEDFFSVGSVSHSSPSFRTNEIELHALRLNLFEEIEKRKGAEEALLHMQNQWQRIAKSLFVGLSFPEIQSSENLQTEIDSIAICQEIVVTRFVCEAVESAIARAESEAVLEEIIELKNYKISRLQDRLQYYEAMNREMSQRNQEVIESARQKRLRRKTRRNWIWGCIGLSVTIGASLLAYSYLPLDCKNASLTPGSDSSSVTPESGKTGAFLPE